MEGHFWQIIKGISFYKRGLVFFTLLALFLVVVVVAVSHFRYSALTLSQLGETYGKTIQQYIYIEKNGQLIMEGKTYRANWQLEDNFDELFLKIIDQPGEYLKEVAVTIYLPKTFTSQSLKNLYQRPPRTNSSYLLPPLQGETSFDTDGQTMVFRAQDLPPEATYTIIVRLPKGTITPPFWAVWYQRVMHLSFWWWMGLGLVFPGFCYLVLLYIIWQKGKSQRVAVPGDILAEPPTNDRPAIIGVLYTGRVGPREIVATLLDLARRKHLIIYRRKETDFLVLKRKEETLDRLSPFEEMLLSKLFFEDQFITHKEDIERRIGRHIFSRKIADVYSFIYQEATARGYFLKNPALVHLVYKTAGIFLFFASLLGFSLATFFAPAEAKFSLLLWAGMLFASLLIVRFSYGVPLRTERGKEVLGRFLAFKNYLESPEPIDYWAGLQEYFEKFLPLAIVFGAEAKWAKRFYKNPFNIPEWYESQEKMITLEAFQEGIFALLGRLAQQLHAAHEPTVD